MPDKPGFPEERGLPGVTDLRAGFPRIVQHFKRRRFPVFSVEETVIMRRISKLFAIVLCAGIMPMIATGQASGTGEVNLRHALEEQDRHPENDDQDAEWAQDPVVFTSRDRGIIRDYYRNRGSHPPPRLAKRGSDFPPGLQKQLKRNGTLPPGLQQQVEPLPGDLEGRLPLLLTFYRRGIIGQDVLIIDIRSRRIIDIVHAVASLRRFRVARCSE